MRISELRRTPLIHAVVLLLVICDQSLAGSALETALRGCMTISNDPSRLSCFDEVMSEHLTAAGRDTAEAVVPAIEDAEPGISKEPVAATGDDTFGKEHWVKSEDELASIESRVERVAKSSLGNLVITLANGQVWKQTNVKRFQVREGDTVVIGRGSFNSFFLKVKDESRLERFHRIQ